LLFVPLNVYAPDVDDIDYSDELGYEGKTPIRVFTIFASQTNVGCGEYDHDKLDFFNMLTVQILSQYDFLPIRGNAHECVLVSGSVDFDRDRIVDNAENYGLTLDDTLKKAKDWHPGLTIIIFDNELSLQYFEQTRVDSKDGHYTKWLGHIIGKSDTDTPTDPTTVVSTSDLNEVEEPEGAWILSHELAHFALRYYNEPSSVWKYYVHDTHDDYRECQKTQFLEDYCSDTYSIVKGHTGNFKILKPYEKPTLTPIVPTPTPIPKPPTSRCPEGYFEIDFTCRKDTSIIIPEKMTIEEYEKSQQEREQRELNEQLVKQQEKPRVSDFVDKTIGIVQWLETDYPASGTGVVRIYDSDMNFDPEAKDSFNVDVWSDSNPRGIELTVTESYKSTGIFEATVFFTTTEKSSSPKLRIAVDDIVTVEYEDRTLPVPYTTTDRFDITATTHMTDPICEDGTVLIDHVCQVEQIEVEKPSKKSVNWFSTLFDWLGGLFQ